MAAKSTEACRHTDPMTPVVFHQADIGEYIRNEDALVWTIFCRHLSKISNILICGHSAKQNETYNYIYVHADQGYILLFSWQLIPSLTFAFDTPYLSFVMCFILSRDLGESSFWEKWDGMKKI